MAELVAGFLGPAIEVVKCIAAPIKRQFNYLCCFNSNIQNLRDEAEKLDDVRKGLQMQVDRAHDNVQVIVPEVETWLRNSTEMKSNMNIILNEVPNVESGCLTLGTRFSLSKRAYKTTDLIKELRGQCKFNIISQPAPPAATEAVPLGTTYEFESRKQFEEDIMRTLRGTDVNMIGICGMGGVGKTTMAKKIMNRALEEHLFDEVVMVVVSQQVDKLRIQLEIGGSLGLKLEEETPQARVLKLHNRLKGTKRILLVLDDVWKSLVLEDIGIPCESGDKRCTILLTSRNRDVLRAMNIPKVCGLQILSEGEAWFLFREKAGICVDASRLKPTAVKVVKECKGLPIALATAGVALKDETNLFIWEDALRQLTKSNPSDIPDIIAEVYNPLKLSYDFLDNEHAKSTFLLCCLFPEDQDIPLEHLTYFAMGLHMFDGIWKLEETRGRMYALIKMLTNRFLLLDGSDEYHVRMHDVVRDVSIFIASKERCINCNDCTWISSYVDGRPRLLVESGLPNLHLLLLDNKVEQEFQINDTFMEGTRELNVLFIKDGLLRSLPSLPHITQLLIYLRTLILYNCALLKTISAVGHFVSLEILICHGCSQIEVSVELRGLKRLKLLEFYKCWNLRVAPGVISCLVELEELKIVESFEDWEGEVEEIERKNAGLRELESLTNLRCLEIEVLNSRLATEQIRLSPKLVKFNVKFGRDRCPGPPPKKYQKKLYLNFAFEDNFWGDLSMNTFLRSTEYLHAYGHCSNVNLDLANARNMRWLTLSAFNNMKNVTESVVSGSRTAVFPLMECLSLEYLDNLEEIWDGPIPPHSFKNLKELKFESLPALEQLWRSPCHNNVVPLFNSLSSIYISRCYGLRHVFPPVTAKDCLSQLEKIEIMICDAMEEVVLLQNEEDEKNGIGQGSRTTVFPKLKSLLIDRMDKLTSICKGSERIEFPVLTEMSIFLCGDMKCLVSNASFDDHSHGHYADDDSLHYFCQPKVSFGSLKKLTLDYIDQKNAWCDKVPTSFFSGLEELQIGSYSNIRSLFSSSMAENLINLQKLNISRCPEMVKVIEDIEEEKEVCGGGMKKQPFPRLQDLCLAGLPKLESFCEWKCAVELPSLKMLRIVYCRQLRRFTAGSLITQALEAVTMFPKELTSVEDLNAAVQQHFSETEERERKAQLNQTEIEDKPEWRRIIS